jgi:hypothetical protein
MELSRGIAATDRQLAAAAVRGPDQRMYCARAEPAGLILAGIGPLPAMRLRKMRQINVNMAVLPDGAVGGC